MLGIRWFWCSVMWPENLAATRSDVGIRRPMRISGRRVHLCFQESNLLYFHLDFKLPQLFPSIYSPKPMYIGLKAGKYHGRMISPSDQFLVCKHPKVKKKDVTIDWHKNSISPIVLRTKVRETSALWIRTSAHMAREPNKVWEILQCHCWWLCLCAHSKPPTSSLFRRKK